MTAGTVVYEKNPAPGNLRSGEGAFIDLKNGDILYVFSRFRGEAVLDYQTADVAALRSRDGGRTFGEEKILLSAADEGAENMMSVSLLRMADGSVGLFYLIRETLTRMRMYLRRSFDEGDTWSEKTLCTPEEGFFVVNNDRVVRLSSGRIVIPAAVHRKGYRAFPDEKGQGFYDSRSECVFFYSDDDGRTWTRSDNKCVLHDTAYARSGLQEPGVVELKNGVLYGWARTDLGRQYEMLSLDGGERWTSSQPSWFTSPNSPLCMKRLPDGRLLAVWNPVPVFNGRSEHVGGAWTGGRTPLVAATSRDEGRTFTGLTVLEDAPDRGYCYAAIHPVSDGVLLAYYCGGEQEGNVFGRSRILHVPDGALSPAEKAGETLPPPVWTQPHPKE